MFSNKTANDEYFFPLPVLLLLADLQVETSTHLLTVILE